MGLREKLAQALMGSAQAQQPKQSSQVDGITAQKFYPIWQQQSIEAQSNGQPFPQFEEWMQQQGGNR